MSFQSRNRAILQQGLYLTASAPRPSLYRRLVLTLALWQQRIAIRRRLAEMDARSLRDLGVSPAAAAFESGKPFWRKMGGLR